MTERTETKARGEGKRATGLYDSFLSFIDLLTRRANAIGAVGVVTMCLITTYEVIMRYIFDRPTSWSLEIDMYLLTLVLFLGLAEALRQEEHVRALFLLTRFRPKVQQIARIVASVLATAAVAVFLWQSLDALINTYQLGEVSMFPLQTPQWLPQAFISLGLSLFLFQWIVRMTLYVRALGTDQILWEKPRREQQ